MRNPCRILFAFPADSGHSHMISPFQNYFNLAPPHPTQCGNAIFVTANSDTLSNRAAPALRKPNHIERGRCPEIPGGARGSITIPPLTMGITSH